MINSNNKRTAIIILSLFFVFGIIFLLSGIYVYTQKADLSQNGCAVQATVVALKEHYISSSSKSSSKKTLVYRPEIEFTTLQGQTIRLIYPSGSNPPSYSVGEKIKILYSKDNPNDTIIDSKFEILVLPIILITLGVIFLIFSICTTIYSNVLRPH